MTRVITRIYSKYYDTLSDTQFNPMLDRVNGLYVGYADVTKKTADALGKRIGFEVLSDADFNKMTSIPELDEPAEPQKPSATGNPVTDAAGSAAEPPAAPASS